MPYQNEMDCLIFLFQSNNLNDSRESISPGIITQHMKKKNFVIVFCCLLFSSGCTFVLKKIYGIKNPEFESHKKILDFKEQIGFSSVPYLGLKLESLQTGHNISVPDVYVFNAQGKYIAYKDTSKLNCNAPAEVFLSALNANTEYEFSDVYTLSTFMEVLENPPCQNLENENYNGFDFYIFMTFARYTGKKIYKDKSRLWYDALQQNKKIRYKLFMVNLDLKECWSPEQKSWLESKSNH